MPAQMHGYCLLRPCTRVYTRTSIRRHSAFRALDILRILYSSLVPLLKRRAPGQMFPLVPCASSWTGVFNQDAVSSGSRTRFSRRMPRRRVQVSSPSAEGSGAGFSLQTAFNNRKCITRRIRLWPSLRVPQFRVDSLVSSIGQSLVDLSSRALLFSPPPPDPSARAYLCCYGGDASAGHLRWHCAETICAIDSDPRNELPLVARARVAPPPFIAIRRRLPPSKPGVIR